MTIEAEENTQQQTFSQEDLSHVAGQISSVENEADDGQDEGAETGDAAAGKDGKPSGEAAEGKEGDAGKTSGKGGKTIASGDDTEDETKAQEATDAEKDADRVQRIKSFRESLARHYAAGNKKAYDQELRRLERMGIERPEQVYGHYRELERWRDEGGVIKVPGKEAKPEDIEAFNKALGVPEEPKGYEEHIQELDNGAVIGSADKPFVDTFLHDLHKAGARPSTVKAAINWYYRQEQENAAARDEMDDTYRRESEAALKEEWGPSFKRRTNALGTLFATAPGGADMKNENSTFARLMMGRTADGKVIGNDPDILRLLDTWRSEINPAASVVEDGAQSGMSIDAELEKLQALRRTDRKKYWSPEVQAREAELYAIQEKLRARQGA